VRFVGALNHEGTVEGRIRNVESLSAEHSLQGTPEFLPQMFDLFVKGTRTLGRTEGGLGIGLTV